MFGVEDAIFRFVEVYEFASNWSRSLDLRPELQIDCTISGIQGQHLSFGPNKTGFSIPHVATETNWTFSRSYPTAELFSMSKQLAIDPAALLFEFFGWDNSQATIASVQEEIRG